MTRRPAYIPPRKAIRAVVKREVCKRSGGICEREGCTRKATEFDHIVPDALGGGSEACDLDHLCDECHGEKTADDVKRIAKADRQGGRSGQYKRRKDRGYSLISGRGFSKPPAGHKWNWPKRKVGQ